MKLTDEILVNIERKNRTYKKYDGKGLYVEIPASGNLRWRLRYTVMGKADTSVSLGIYPTVSIDDARAKACEILEWLAAGIDPLEYLKSTQPKQEVNKEAKIKVAKIKKESRIDSLELRIAELEERLCVVRETIKDILYAPTPLKDVS